MFLRYTYMNRVIKVLIAIILACIAFFLLLMVLYAVLLWYYMPA